MEKIKIKILMFVSLIVLILFSGCSNDEQNNYKYDSLKCLGDSYLVCDIYGEACTCERYKNVSFKNIETLDNQ